MAFNAHWAWHGVPTEGPNGVEARNRASKAQDLPAGLFSLHLISLPTLAIWKFWSPKQLRFSRRSAISRLLFVQNHTLVVSSLASVTSQHLLYQLLVSASVSISSSSTSQAWCPHHPPEEP